MEQSQVLENDKSALLDIFVWLFLVSSILGVIVEAVTKLVIRRRLGTEDYLILLSLVCHFTFFILGLVSCVVFLGILSQSLRGGRDKDERESNCRLCRSSRLGSRPVLASRSRMVSENILTSWRIFSAKPF